MHSNCSYGNSVTNTYKLLYFVLDNETETDFKPESMTIRLREVASTTGWAEPSWCEQCAPYWGPAGTTVCPHTMPRVC